MCYTFISMDKQRIIDIAKPILKKHLIKKAALFGSVSRGLAGSDSDIDMLIDPPKNFGLFDMAGLKVDLEDALHRDVDLVKYDSIRPILKNAILKYEYTFL